MEYAPSRSDFNPRKRQFWDSSSAPASELLVTAMSGAADLCFVLIPNEQPPEQAFLKKLPHESGAEGVSDVCEGKNIPQKSVRLQATPEIELLDCFFRFLLCSRAVEGFRV